ncbi:SGNH/GDSL hydrolase family protein [Pedobacter sp. JCM 36344]|uniref:SGNH/GDSL hydrolase family protein n=1 Tax=Pedobacter sp. JCM 36344 TaxID=3374280 RepID=UPI00397CCFF9
MRKRIIDITLIIVVFASISFKKKEVTWVAIGDSITYLNDHINETGNRVTKGYMTRVQEALPHINFINQGHNGWTSSGIAREIDKLGIVKADIYSVFLGTNDWWSGIPIGKLSDYEKDTGNNTLYGSFRIIINKIRMLNPDAKIILITPMQRTDFVYLLDKNNNAWGSYHEKNGQLLESFANAINEIGRKEKIKVIDLFHRKGMAIKNLVAYKRLKDPLTGVYQNYPYPEYTKIPFSPSDEYPYPESAINVTYDGLHPSDRGYQIISQELIKVLKPL